MVFLMIENIVKNKIHGGFNKVGMRCVITLKIIPIRKLQTRLLRG